MYRPEVDTHGAGVDPFQFLQRPHNLSQLVERHAPTSISTGLNPNFIFRCEHGVAPSLDTIIS
jgi:hypothetical protein